MVVGDIAQEDTARHLAREAVSAFGHMANHLLANKKSARRYHLNELKRAYG